MTKFGFGQSVTRVEDLRLITGAGRFSDDVEDEGDLHIAVVRSPFANATVGSIDVSAAAEAEGVLEVVTAETFGEIEIPCLAPPSNHDGAPAPVHGRPILASRRALHVGDAVAFVIADSRARALDAAELVEIDWDAGAAVAEASDAIDPAAAQVHGDAPGNLAFDWRHGDAGAVDAAFASAAKTVTVELINNRVISNPMEPRAAHASWDAEEGKLTFEVGSQGVWQFKQFLAEAVLDLPEEKVRVVTHDVGGGFGTKAFFYPEYAMVAWAAKKHGRSARWRGERGEIMLSDVAGRDHVTKAELALDAGGIVQAMRVETIANMGAYLNAFAPFIPTGAALKVLPGVYDVKNLHYRVLGVYTHTTPVDAYRGAGRPESIYCVERLMDAAARELGEDPIAFRKKNMIGVEQLPFTTAVGEVYDSGDFRAVIDRAAEKFDWAGFEARRAEAAARGKKRGRGVCYYIESTMGSPIEHADVRFTAEGEVTVRVGTQANGQGHETSYMQVLHDRLGVPFDKIRVIQGDSELIPDGGGTGGSRSLTAQGMAIRDASDLVIDKGKIAAGEVFEAAAADIAFDRATGAFSVAGTDKAIGVVELAAKVAAMTEKPEGLEDGLDSRATTKIPAWTFPNGCHMAEVEIDPDTGTIEIVRYSVIDDFGVILNPMLVEGQVHGGVVQGLGQAIIERTVFDPEGQLLTGSFMDYAMPRAADMPSFEFETFEGAPCKNNAMGIKGCGEAGSVGACASVINAMIDALADDGVRALDMPVTPLRLWEAMRSAA